MFDGGMENKIYAQLAEHRYIGHLIENDAFIWDFAIQKLNYYKILMVLTLGLV